MKCKINAWGCIYHACMSNDCQKRYMKRKDLGDGRCKEKLITKALRTLRNTKKLKL